MVGPQSYGNVLQGGDTGSAPVCLGYLVHIGDNVENGGRDSHRLSETNHGKSGVAEGIWDVVYFGGGGSAGSGSNSVGYNLHQKKMGYGRRIGGA